MKTMGTRLFSILLAALTLLSAALAAGCGSGGDSPAPADTALGETAAAETAAETTEPPEYIPPAQGLGGAEIRYAMVKQPSPNWIIRTYVEGVSEELNGDPINDAIFNRNRYVEEALDCKIVPVLYENTDPMLKATMAGDSYCEFMTVAGTGMPGLLNKHILIDLKTIDTLDLSASWWDQNSVKQLSIANRLFAAVGNISSFAFVGSYAVFANKGIIESYGLENPYEAVRGGKWTFDKMGEMAKAVAHDLNGDGQPGKEDMFGLSSEALGMVMLNAAGCRFTEKDENDIPQITLADYDVTGALEKIVPLFRDRTVALYSGDYSSGYKNVFRQLIVEKFIADELLFINNWVLVALELRDMQSDFGILPPPKGSEEQESYVDYGSETWLNYAVVPITVADTAPVGLAMDALGYYGKTEIYKAVIETTITDKALRDTDTEEMLNIIYNNRRYELAGIFNWGDINGMASNFIGNNKTDFASQWAKTESKVQKALQKTIDEITAEG